MSPPKVYHGHRRFLSRFQGLLWSNRGPQTSINYHGLFDSSVVRRYVLKLGRSLCFFVASHFASSTRSGLFLLNFSFTSPHLNLNGDLGPLIVRGPDQVHKQANEQRHVEEKKNTFSPWRLPLKWKKKCSSRKKCKIVIKKP